MIHSDVERKLCANLELAAEASCLVLSRTVERRVCCSDHEGDWTRKYEIGDMGLEQVPRPRNLGFGAAGAGARSYSSRPASSRQHPLNHRWASASWLFMGQRSLASRTLAVRNS
jgi:hypothetical protein